MKKILFITWDGPQTSYMEGLFMPIFHAIGQADASWEFHVLQFTWAGKEKTDQVAKKAEELGIHYRALPILKKPVASLGSLVTLFTSSGKIKKYIQEHKIDILMPRATFPAFMVNQIQKDFTGKIIFDADGLPIEERVDFAGLQKGSRQYRWMKSIETQMLKSADAVITRSQKAIEIHLQNIGEQHRNKFSVVINGRNKDHFDYNHEFREIVRKKLGVNNEFLFIYVGSLGAKYALHEMYNIYKEASKNRSTAFLVLTGDQTYIKNNIPNYQEEGIIIKTVKASEVADYISAADLGFALIYPTFSMRAAVPTKLGEYLLCGLPVIASKGIGDSESILENFEECYLFDHARNFEENLEAIEEFIENPTFADREEIRRKALETFSLESASESYIYVLRNI